LEIAIVAVGRMKAGPESELCARYLDRAARLGKGLGFRGFKVSELAESRAARAADRIAAEEQVLLAEVAKSARCVCLDADGALVDSDAFAAGLARSASDAAGRTAFVIGGPDGLGEGILAKADMRLSFGRLTWPHQLVRIMLAEQLYRAMTILSGHPYHRA
jgi:23S rRNA (pseudouridine1915-N3)-methyltransferase